MLRTRKTRTVVGAFVGLTLALAAGLAALNTPAPPAKKPAPLDVATLENAQRMVEEGRQIFRYDTFGDEDFWGGMLRLHEAVATVTPKQALGLGLKVDSEALPAGLVADLKAGKVNLDDPATTLALLKLGAVVGVKGFFDGDKLKSVGITCAVCHSTVDDSLAPGIGKRLDGWPNQDLNVGAIVAAAPDLSVFAKMLKVDEATVRKVLNSWGPGKFDAELNLDGKAFRPDGKPAATLIPPAFRLAGINLHTWTGSWGTVSYWNAFVANLEMHGKGTFFDPRLDNAQQYPVAAGNRLGHKRDSVDLITAKLPALHYYQLSLVVPRPPAGSFDRAAAGRGKVIFDGKAQCANCHVPPLFTEPGWNLHTPEEIGIDDFQSNRSPDHRYRTAPLNGLWAHSKRGFYHDGRFATLTDVVNHYNTLLKLGLGEPEKRDLVQYLKSLPE